MRKSKWSLAIAAHRCRNRSRIDCIGSFARRPHDQASELTAYRCAGSHRIRYRPVTQPNNGWSADERALASGNGAVFPAGCMATSPTRII